MSKSDFSIMPRSLAPLRAARLRGFYSRHVFDSSQVRFDRSAKKSINSITVFRSAGVSSL